MPNLKNKSYNKNAKRERKYGKKGNKSTFRQIRPYGIKPDPFPARLHTRLKFASDLILTSGTLIAGVESVFRLSSIYDPDYSGLGRTVVGHSTMASIYESYIVKGVKIECQFWDPSADGMVGIASLNQTDSVQSKSLRAITEQSLTYNTVVNNTGSQKSKMNFYVTPWSLKGLSKLEWDANKTSRSSLMGTNPAQDIFFRVATQGNTTSDTMNCTIRLIYYVELFNRKQLTSSVIA